MYERPRALHRQIFHVGNSQAVQPPKDCSFTTDKVEVSREGDAVILYVRGPTGTDAGPHYTSLYAHVLPTSTDRVAIDKAVVPLATAHSKKSRDLFTLRDVLS